MKINKLISFLIILILVVVPTMAASAYNTQVQEVSASAFTPRLSAPSKTNSYYYSNHNIFYQIGYGMPNCTAYAWGRAYEILKERPKLSVDSAHYWYNYNKTNKYYPYGQTPKVGAIACWNNPYGGHVAVVEKIENGTVTLSHSAWGGPNFYTTTYSVGDKSAGVYSSGWSFYGYIYILEGATTKPTTGDVYRITSGDGVNLRKAAGTTHITIGAIPYNAEITVTEYKVGGYLWGKTTYDGMAGWCVLDYAKLIADNPVPALPGETPPTTVPPVTEVPTEPITTTPVVVPTEAPTSPMQTDSIPDIDTEMGVKPQKNGDVNSDGVINIKDANLIQKYVADASKALSNFDVTQADVNLDGNITVEDSTCLQKVIANLV